MAWLEKKLNTLANCLYGFGIRADQGKPSNRAKIVAHRGAYVETKTVENTMDAFAACCKNKIIWGIETDVRLTADLEPVLHHDPDCGRLFGHKELIIAETKFTDLRKTVPEIPLLKEIITEFSGDLHLMIEIKENPFSRPGLVQAIYKALKTLEPQRDFHLLSLIPEFLDYFTMFPKSAFMDVAGFNMASILKKNMSLGHGCVSGSFALLTNRRLKHLHDQGKQAGAGFIETEEVFNREVNRGMDWLFTNHPLRLAEFSTQSACKPGIWKTD